MNDDCDSGKCSRPIKPSQAMRGYRHMTGKMFVDEVTLRKAQAAGDQETIAEYLEMYGSLN